MSGYKLTYFPIRGKAQVIRYLLEDNALPYEDETVTKDTWPSVKPKMVFGQIPCFHDGDFELVQSAAIVRYLARKHDLYGANHTEAALMDMVYDGVEDLKKKFSPMLYTKENYEEAKTKYMENLPKELERFENLLKKNNGGDGFVVGNKISYTDYAVFDLIYNHVLYAPECLKTCPLLKAFLDRMKTRENLAKYMNGDTFKALKYNGSGRL